MKASTSRDFARASCQLRRSTDRLSRWGQPPGDTDQIVRIEGCVSPCPRELESARLRLWPPASTLRFAFRLKQGLRHSCLLGGALNLTRAPASLHHAFDWPSAFLETPCAEACSSVQDEFDLDNAIQTYTEFSYATAVMDRTGGWEEGEGEQENWVLDSLRALGSTPKPQCATDRATCKT